jgi:hypothetical protein
MSENKTQNKEKKEEKESKIPNSLIIYIKTRIPNFYKINYEPYMSVPKNKSHTVYFDPLVKYYEGPIKNLPPGAPKDALLTQFFEASEFDSMINRILSDFRYMQKPRTFKQAYDENIIENNLHITLKNLFNGNNLFYINKKPYTVVGVKSNPSDWQIDKKPLEKLLNQFSHLSIKQLEDEANNEEDDIPEVLRQGNVASSSIAENENISSVAAGLTNAVNNEDDENLEKEISGITESFIPQNELPGVSKHISDLYTKYLRQNVPINYSNATDMARDPLTLSLLIDSADLLNFINKNKKSNLIDLYSAFINSKSGLQEADKSYSDSCIELAKYKTNFDREIYKIRGFIRSGKISYLDATETKQIYQDLIVQITELKNGYIQLIFQIADAINTIYEQQTIYFLSTKLLLEGLKNDYVNIIKYYEKPELALKCIDNDIYTISSLLEPDINNPYSASYYKNYENFKKFYTNQLYKNREKLLAPNINFADEASIYINQPNVLLIEIEQYDIYNFKLFLSYSYNQFDIWTFLFKSIEIFVRFISKETNDIISLSDVSMKTLNDNYSLEQQNDMLKKMKVEGIRATIDKQTKELKWFLVKDDGTNAMNPKILTDKQFEEQYIEYIKTSVKAYDAITLYIYLLEIMCLRQNRVYVAEENVNQLNLEYSLSSEQYYDTIIKHIKTNKSGNKTYIPDSLLWDISNLDNAEFVKNKKNINTKSNIIYRGRIKSIAKSREDLVSSCEEISKIITPNISKTGFINECNNIISRQISSITPHTFKSSYWLDQTIENYDIQGTSDLIYNMNKVVKDAWYDRIIEDISVNSYMDWMVFSNNKNDIESIYAAVADGLNRQLDLTENETTNPYTEEKDGQRLFTTNTIKQMVTDFKTEDDSILDLNNVKNVIMILEQTLKIKFIIFQMLMVKDNLSFNMNDMVSYKGRPHRLISINKDENDEEISYNLYNGYSEIKNVNKKKIKAYSDNFLKNFNIYCEENSNNSETIFTDFMYLLVKIDVNKDNKEIFNYKLVRDTNLSYIFTSDKIPIYIKYLIFNSCPYLNKDKLTKMGFVDNQIQDDILNFEKKRREHIETTNIRDDISNIDKKIEKYKTIYKNLKSIKDKNLEQQAEQVLYKEEIKELQQRKQMLRELLNQQEPSLGGAVTLRPSEQYSSYVPQYNPLEYPLNPNIPKNVIYIPQQSYLGPSYLRQGIVPYNVFQNKAKDQKSKLSFYITIELELFPGTSINMLQKSIVKCQSTFERIREAWADIFGFEYRPAPMSQAYAYGLEKNKDNNSKSEKKGTKVNNKTRKLKK